MSVYTTVSDDELRQWLTGYSVGHLVHSQGILAGIENTNYFVTTSQGRFVLTLFEKLTVEQLPFYLELMAHLANHGLPCPRPVANLDNGFLGQLNARPASLVTRLPGRPVMTPDEHHCARVGEVLADLVGAGLCGTLSTWSALAVRLGDDLLAGSVARAVAWGGVSVAAGVVAAWAGARLQRQRDTTPPTAGP